jgi:type II secretory pathway pseudopilin PulG
MVARKNHFRRAVTLVEILVATVFLGICGAAVTDTIGTSLTQIARMERRAVALNLVKNELEYWTAYNQRLNMGVETRTRTELLPGNVTCTLTTLTSDDPSTTYDRFTVTASWPERKGSRNYTEQLRLQTEVRSPND